MNRSLSRGRGVAPVRQAALRNADFESTSTTKVTVLVEMTY